MASRLLNLLLGVLLLGRMSLPTHALVLPETRVGNFFPASPKSAQAGLHQSLEPRRENRGYDYDFASGVHKYLYGQDNPVNMVDPSGHESLASVNFSMAIVSQMVMHELRGAHGALVGARAMFGSDEDLNSIIHGMEVVMAVDDAVSTVALGAGVLYGRKLIKNIRAITAAEANAGHTYPNPSGYGPAYKAGTRPRQFTTAAELKFVRVHGPSNQDGGWLVRADEIAGMNAKQIQEHLALKHTPTHISDVTVPAGVEMRVGIAAEQEGFGVSGGGIQYELLDRAGTMFSNMRELQ